jgi:hypothetical protein
MEEIPLRATSALLPIRRCLLAEKMVALLQPVPEAESVVRALIDDAGARPPHSLYGPDLDTVEHWKCTADRCMTSCSPSYRSILERFGAKDPEEIDCGMESAAPKQSGA